MTEGLTVIIGENGTGKSSIIEALEILRRASSPNFMQEVFQIHGGAESLLRKDADELTLDLHAVSNDSKLEYSVSIGPEQQGVIKERLSRNDSDLIFSRELFQTEFPGLNEEQYKNLRYNQMQLALSSFGMGAPFKEIPSVLNLLANIQVQVPFNVQPGWAGRLTKRHSQLRESMYIQPADKLELFGANLPNAWYELRNGKSEQHWLETIELVQLGLGDDIESVVTRPDAGGGSIALAVKYRNIDRAVPATLLSDGELAFLAIVALVRLGDQASLIAFDEPDLHLHPRLLIRVVDMLQEVSETRPVVITTHSDRLLDALDDPASSVRVIDLDENRGATLSTLDRAELDKWLEKYNGFGEIRANGYDKLVTSKGRQDG
jgi:predicted ATPase